MSKARVVNIPELKERLREAEAADRERIPLGCGELHALLDVLDHNMEANKTMRSLITEALRKSEGG